MSAAPIPVETLLAHREWVRSVARAVVRDENAADDVEQETWVAALSQPPRDRSSLRGWFGAVTRSRALRIGRTDSRRDARELAAARREATPSAADLAELADTHRRVVAAVVALEEPYRETILLRYFEGLAIDAVAARSGVPLETARSRLKRGVAKLRERLAEELGEDDRPWQLALVPLIGRPHVATGGAGVAVGGGLLMASTTKTAAVVAALLLLAGLGAVLVPRWTASDEKAVAHAPPPPTSEGAIAVARAPRTRAHDAATPSIDATPAPREEAAAPTPPRSVEERLRDRVEPLELGPDTAFGRLADETHVPIVLSAEAAQLLAKVPRGVGITCLVRRRGADMLDSVTKTFGLGYVVENDRVVVTPPDKKWDATQPVVVVPRPAPVADVVVLGTVTDAEGRIVVGAEIFQVLGEDIRRGVTDIAGRYEIRLRRPLGMVEARAAGQATSLAVPVKAAPGAQFVADLALRGPSGSLTVRASTDAGPAPGVTVMLGAGEDAPVKLADGSSAVQRALDAVTDASGAAVFDGLPPGTLSARAYLKGSDAATGKARVVAGKSTELALKFVKLASVKDRLASTRVSARFKDMRVSDAVNYFNAVSKIPIVIAPALAERTQELAVTLEIQDRSLTDALDALCREIGGAKYDVRDEIVWITTAR